MKVYINKINCAPSLPVDQSKKLPGDDASSWISEIDTLKQLATLMRSVNAKDGDFLITQQGDALVLRYFEKAAVKEYARV